MPEDLSLEEMKIALDDIIHWENPLPVSGLLIALEAVCLKRAEQYMKINRLSAAEKWLGSAEMVGSLYTKMANHEMTGVGLP